MDETTELQVIGQRIRDARIAKKMSQADLAFSAGIAVPHMSCIELGKKKMNVLIFSRIIAALKVSADEILRSDVPAVTSIYQGEFAQILSDCSPVEADAIIKMAKELKATIRSQKPTDY